MSRLGIAAVGHELHPFIIADGLVCQSKRLQHHFVARTFAIKGKAVAGMSDSANARWTMYPLHRRGGITNKFRCIRWPISRIGRILGKQMQDVGQQQLLMLLLVLNAKLNQVKRGLG